MQKGEDKITIIDNGSVPAKLDNVFSDVSWSRRTNEPVEQYAVFAEYLHHKTMDVNTWVDNLSDKHLAKYPKGLKSIAGVRLASRKWKWQLRKNDMVRQTLDLRHSGNIDKLNKTREMIGESYFYLVAKIAKDAKKLYESDETLDFNQMAAFMAKFAELDIMKSVAETNKQAASVKNMPTDQLKKVLEALKDKG